MAFLHAQPTDQLQAHRPSTLRIPIRICVRESRAVAYEALVHASGFRSLAELCQAAVLHFIDQSAAVRAEWLARTRLVPARERTDHVLSFLIWPDEARALDAAGSPRLTRSGWIRAALELFASQAAPVHHDYIVRLLSSGSGFGRPEGGRA